MRCICAAAPPRGAQLVRTGSGRAYLARDGSDRHAHDRSAVGSWAARIEATTPAGSQWYGLADQDAFGSTTAQGPSASWPTSRTYPAGPARGRPLGGRGTERVLVS